MDCGRRHTRNELYDQKCKDVEKLELWEAVLRSFLYDRMRTSC